MASTAIASKIGALSNISKGVSGSKRQFLAAVALNKKVTFSLIFPMLSFSYYFFFRFPQLIFTARHLET